MSKLLTQPMLATSEIPNIYEDVEYPCLIQPKFDGIRCIAINGVAYSRKMKPIPNQFIQKFFSDNNLHGLDGELMIHGDFNKVQSAVMSEDGEPNFYYAVYDYWDSDQPYKVRAGMYVNKVLELRQPERVKNTQSILVSSPESVETELQFFIDNGYEGAMLRKLDGKYKQGRSTFKEGYLLKLKRFFDDEAIVIGFEEKMSNTNTKEVDERGYSKRSSKKEGLVPANTLGSLQVDWNGVIFNIGSGFNDEQRQEIWDNRDKYLGKLVTFKYQEIITDTGRPRFPVWKWWRKELEEYN